MNDWHLDSVVAHARVNDSLARAERARLARAEPAVRAPLRLRVRLELQVSFGRERAGAAPAVSEPAA